MTIRAPRRPSRRRLLYGAGTFGLAAAGLSLLSICGVKAGEVGVARSGKTPVVGYLALHPLDRGGLSPGGQRLFGVANADPFRQGLGDLGYVEGKTIRIEYRFAGDDRQRLQQLALELTRLPVDVL